MRFQSKIMREVILSLVSLCLLLIFVGIATAQAQVVDAGFNPTLTKESTFVADSANGEILIQPDGKMIMRAVYTQVTTPTYYLFRLNADGTMDNAFDCSTCPNAVPFLQPDGKLLFVVEAQNGFLKLIRHSSNGSFERELPTPLSRGGGFSISGTIWAVLPDEKIYLEADIFHQFAAPKSLYRLNSDGTLDPTFQPISVSSRFYDTVVDFILLPDGKFYRLDGSNNGTQGGNLYRHNANGSVDTSFESPSVSCNGCVPFGLARPFAIGLQSDGKVLMGGLFNSVNGIARTNFVRLHAAGNVDLDFNVALNSVAQINVLPDNKILLRGGAGAASLTRLNADGTPDNTFNAPTDIFFWRIKVDNLGRIVFFGQFADQKFKFGRLNPNGSLETTFGLPATKGSVSTLARQADGKIIVAGEFDKINGTTLNKIARLNADGSVDTSFNPLGGFDMPPAVIAVQADGKILAGGLFTLFDGMQRAYLVRLNQNGSLDSAFNPILNSSVRTIAVQTDGKILIGGIFNAVTGTPRPGFARLNADGSLDMAFNPQITGGQIVEAVTVEADGKIVIGGSFSGINGFSRANMARLTADGNLDTTFNAPGVATVRRIIRQADGKYLILSGSTGVSRRNADGTADAAFQTPTFTHTSGTPSVDDIALLPNGTIIVCGLFSSVNGSTRNNLARLLPDGGLDGFYLLKGANGVRTLLAQPDGKTIVGGVFTIIENTNRSGIARLNGASFITNPPDFDFNGDGKADLAVFRPANGFWYIARPTGVPNQNFDSTQFGANGDLIVPADYDGDGRTDVAVFRPADGAWYLLQSTAGFRPVSFGQNGDIPVPGDYDGDGKANLAVFRPSTGSWYIARPTGIPSQNFITYPFGISTDKPIAGADFDGDGKADIAVWRPSDGVWYRINSATNSFSATQFGINIDRPAPADYDGDGRADLAVFRPTEGIWYLLGSTNGFSAAQFGTGGDLPAANAFIR